MKDCCGLKNASQEEDKWQWGSMMQLLKTLDLWYCWTMVTSEGFKTRLAKPDIKTGAYKMRDGYTICDV